MVWNIALGIGAAVAGRFIDRDGERNRGGNSENNRKVQKQLEETRRQLKDKDAKYAEALQRCDDYKQQTTSLKAERDTLARKAESAAQMAAQAGGANLVLSMQHKQLADSFAMLEERAKQLLRERDELADKMRHLELQQQEFAAAEASLKDRIASILKQYFGQRITEADAILQMAELGVDVEPATIRSLDAAGAQEFDVQTTLVLDDPGRMAHLMMKAALQPAQIAHGSSSSGGGGGSGGSSGRDEAPVVPRLQLNFLGFKEGSSSMMLSWSDAAKGQEAAPGAAGAEARDAPKQLQRPDAGSGVKAAVVPGKPSGAAGSSGGGRGAAALGAMVQGEDGSGLVLSFPGKAQGAAPTAVAGIGKLLAKMSGSPVKQPARAGRGPALGLDTGSCGRDDQQPMALGGSGGVGGGSGGNDLACIKTTGRR